jgi:hypothetical protein
MRRVVREAVLVAAVTGACALLDVWHAWARGRGKVFAAAALGAAGLTVGLIAVGVGRSGR